MPKRIPPLTATQVERAKPQEKETTLFDGGGLYLLITPSGGKLWHLKYRHQGKAKRISLGIYPAVTLADARQRREDAKKLLANGVDPGEMKKSIKQAKTALEENSFEIVAREWHSKYKATWSEIHGSNIIDRLEKEVFPCIGNKTIGEIKAPEVLSVLRRMETRGALDTAHSVRNHCSNVFRYAIATGRAERDVAADLRGAYHQSKEIILQRLQIPRPSHLF